MKTVDTPALNDRTKFRWRLLALLVVGFVLCFNYLPTSAEKKTRLLPQFHSTNQQDWLNSKPLSVEDLRGRVLLVDFWTYSCHNCYRSIPWLLELEQSFDPKDFLIVGIHTPEFKHEHDRRNVARKLKQFGITHPVMMDNDYVYWNRLNNRYWPSFYLVDKQGQIRGLYIGETHSGTSRAKAIGGAIEKLISEPDHAVQTIPPLDDKQGSSPLKP